MNSSESASPKWKLVPVEPDAKMCKAARNVPEPVKPYPPHFHLIWDAMLSASPAPSAPEWMEGAKNATLALPDQQPVAQPLRMLTEDETLERLVDAYGRACVEHSYRASNVSEEGRYQAYAALMRYASPQEGVHQSDSLAPLASAPNRTVISICHVAPPGFGPATDAFGPPPVLKGSTPTADDVKTVDLRQSFESWARNQPGDDMPLEGAQWGVNWMYANALTQAAWVGYQAHARGVPGTDEARMQRDAFALRVLLTDDLGKAQALVDEIAVAGVGAVHTDHPLRHYDRTCPACNAGVTDTPASASDGTAEPRGAA